MTKRERTIDDIYYGNIIYNNNKIARGVTVLHENIKIDLPQLGVESISVLKSLIYSFTDYERNRYIYIYKGLFTITIDDIIINILLYLFTLYHYVRGCDKHRSQETITRIYSKEEHGQIFDDIIKEHHQFQKNKVILSRNKLKESGIPDEYLLIINCNDDPLDGNGIIMDNKDDFIFHDTYKQYIIIPYQFVYDCIDINDIPSIRKYLSYNTLPDEEIMSIIVEIKKKDKITIVYNFGLGPIKIKDEDLTVLTK